MNKLLLTGCLVTILGLFSVGFVLVAEDPIDAAVDSLTPAGYNRVELKSCLKCAHQAIGWKGNTHLENAGGYQGIVGEGHAPAAALNPIGWSNSGHAHSQDTAGTSNTYCANCHAPSDPKLTNDPAQSTIRKKDKEAVTCLSCHCSHGIAAQYGTRFTNYIPGSAPTKAESFIPRHIEDGKSANEQCLYCHGKYHGFNDTIAGSLHADLVKNGTLRCVDCHMHVFNILASGLEERAHNMDGDNCTHCHVMATQNWTRRSLAKIFFHSDKKLP